MKLQLLIALLLSPVALAQHPLDFVPDDAIAVISVKDGDAINSIMNTISQEVRKTDSNVLHQYLGQFIKNPDSVDLTSEVLFVIAPAAVVPGKSQGGMFGAIPEPMMICKAKQGQTIEIISPGTLKSTTSVDGWFVATASEQWTPRTAARLAPIVGLMPDSQISATLDFGTLWKQFGPMAQMLGGLGIGSLNTPGPSGVVSSETKKATAAAGKAFREIVAWCSEVKDISAGIDFESYTAAADFNVNMNDPKTIKIDNDSLIEMSMHLADDMSQYAMSERLLKQVMEADLDSLQHLIPQYYDGPPTFASASVKALSALAKDSVVAYGLHPTNGLTISSMADVTDQDKYLESLPSIIEDFSGLFIQELHMALPPAVAPHTWNVSMIGSEDTEMEVLNAVFPEGDQLRFGKQGNGRIAMAIGPRAWKAFVQPHSTPLSQVMRKHNKRAEIDFAMTVDVRGVVVGVSDIAKIAFPEEEINIATSPSAKTSLMFGSTQAGSFLEFTADLFGLAKLFKEIDMAEPQNMK